MTDQTARLRALAAHFRKMGENADARSRRAAIADMTTVATATANRASAYLYCATALEREIAEPVVRDMLSASLKDDAR